MFRNKEKREKGERRSLSIMFVYQLFFFAAKTKENPTVAVYLRECCLTTSNNEIYYVGINAS
jgi:hypothetical protein